MFQRITIITIPISWLQSKHTWPGNQADETNLQNVICLDETDLAQGAASAKLYFYLRWWWCATDVGVQAVATTHPPPPTNTHSRLPNNLALVGREFDIEESNS